MQKIYFYFLMYIFYIAANAQLYAHEDFVNEYTRINFAK
jgi:hypothetical protein